MGNSHHLAANLGFLGGTSAQEPTATSAACTSGWGCWHDTIHQATTIAHGSSPSDTDE
jgi:hypothetical protein